MTLFHRVQNWYIDQCNGEWEHQHGISIESCDNPGWWVKISLQGTPLEHVLYVRVSENVDDQGFQKGPRWLNCHVVGGIWHGGGDETKLERILELFLSWAKSYGG